MRLLKNEVPAPMPIPLQPDSAGGQEPRLEVVGTRFGVSPEATLTVAPGVRAVADLLDLTADHRGDLLETLLAALKDSDATREHAEHLMDLVTACGLAEGPRPCATAMEISADLERLAHTSSQWTHPAQVVPRPDAQALYKLCAARIGRENGSARERLERILPRLERTARLTEKAASRRHQSAARQPQRLDRWR